MRSVCKWFSERLHRESAGLENESIRSTASANAVQQEAGGSTRESDTSTNAENDTAVEGNALMPNIYASKDEGTEPQLRVLQETSIDVRETKSSVESVGVDPYNTGRLDISKSRRPKSK